MRNTMYYKKGGVGMTVSLRLNDADAMLIKKYAEMKGQSVSDIIRQSVLERIEDEFDLSAYEAAMKEYRADPVSF